MILNSGKGFVGTSGGGMVFITGVVGVTDPPPQFMLFAALESPCPIWLLIVAIWVGV